MSDEEDRMIRIEVYSVMLIPLYLLRKQLASQGLQIVEGPGTELDILKHRVEELENRHRVAEAAYKAAVDSVKVDPCRHRIIVAGQCMNCGAEV